MTTRGIRNNNPGNIDKGQKWQGLASVQSDPRFCTFVSPEYGVRAMCKLFITYMNKYALRTIQKIVHKYAPPVENKTDKYIENVCKWSGLTADQQLTADRRTLLALIPAFIRMETGVQPYDKATIERGVDLALT